MTVHVNGKKYEHDDSVVVYFGFPRLGIAVPLRPDDDLIFNPMEEHALSSRCDNETEVYTISLYLKTAVVGMNENDVQLTPSLEMLLNQLSK